MRSEHTKAMLCQKDLGVRILAQPRHFMHAIVKLAGSTGEGSTLWLWLNGLVSAVWWIVTIWMVLLIMGSTLWAGLLYGEF